jgi:hypothetical protein
MRRTFRKGVASLAIATLAFASSAATLMDGIDSGSAAHHFEGPGGPPTESPFHNHSLCAMVGATPVLPGGALPTAVPAGDVRNTVIPQTWLAPVGVRISACRSRAPPTL